MAQQRRLGHDGGAMPPLINCPRCGQPWRNSNKSSPPAQWRKVPVGGSLAKVKRIVDPGAIAKYVATHPRCEVQRCTSDPMPEPHHIRPKSVGGDDVPENLIRLCFHHHLGNDGVHRGHRRWWQKHASQLDHETLRKGQRAWPPKQGYPTV